MKLSNTALKMRADARKVSWSENTERAYERQFNWFRDWCEANNTPSMPAEPNAIINYLAELVAQGKSLSYVKIARNAIRGYHKLHHAGPNPIKDPAIAEYLESAYATAEKEPRGQALPLRQQEVDFICDYLEAEVHEAKTWLQRDRALRKIALLRVGADAALRRGELIALTWADVTFPRNGSKEMTTVRIVRSKTSDDPATLPVGKKAADALRAVYDFGAWEDTDLVFRLKTGHAVTMWIRKVTLTAGLIPPMGRNFSGHSLRMGRAIELAERGGTTLEVGAMLRHRDASMAEHYSKAAMGSLILRKYFAED
ncbi:tyrosine-type recombinase/integrase [Candidatus Palauibacter sp.]|uniref:tyrosine-type recombinase/integrase n=1 Tax=Candidatus Palauibacter sp. TaxID=3101350 RepID=UPI003C6F28A9